ncbi:MAG: nucleotide exchange factor GrpE [Oscillospiraceae bacterium]|nr:nucleotide exchange factor GrpE [Oscillospiraceae bacterium]
MDNKEKLENQDVPQQETVEEKIDVVKGIETLETALIESEKKLEAATKELEDTKNTFQRTLAEYDNYRKRTTKEKADNYNAGRTDAVKAILPMLDTLEMALAAPCSDENYKKGIELTYTTAMNSLKNMGVEQIDALNQPFDPNFHNAVMQQETEGVEPGIVVNVFQKGYKMGDKIIREATVVVSC